MIQIKDKHDCCGCEACVQACPKQCILLETDKEGFLYPYVEKNKCVDCGLCNKICPVINIRNKVEPLSVWAAQNIDDKIRMESSSGGIVSMFAEEIIKKGGVVFGVTFNDKWDAVHTCVESVNQLAALRGSKYVQSRIGDSFKNVKKKLKEGRDVLFIGTPCQVSGLKYFLGRNYSNLITVDFICHGVPSPGVFKWYLQEMLNKYESDRKDEKNKGFSSCVCLMPQKEIFLPDDFFITNIKFRDKREGWKKYSLSIFLEEKLADGKNNMVSISENVTKSIFLRGFCSDLFLRPSCHLCPTRMYRSGSDITVADFWGQEYMFPEFDKDTGVSCVIIKSNKGYSLFNSIEDVKKEEKTIDQVLLYNPSLLYSKREPYIRKKFWRNVGKYSLEETINKAVKLNYLERFLLKVKVI